MFPTEILLRAWMKQHVRASGKRAHPQALAPRCEVVVQTVGYTAHMIFQTASETRQCDGSVFQVFRFQQIVLQPALLPDLQAVGFGSVNRAAERVLYESEFHTSLYRPLM